MKINKLILLLLGFYILGALTPMSYKFLNGTDMIIEKNINLEQYLDLKKMKDYLNLYYEKNKRYPINLNDYFKQNNIEFKCDLKELTKENNLSILNLNSCNTEATTNYYISNKYQIYFKNLNTNFNLSLELIDKNESYYNIILYNEGKYIYI